ncbi:hypothetical protein HK100_009969 [Physocladia obscura]|uniref:Doublecortin domain-containing protein n=1 Tax=Physocladia obscura TaxID=109957 RepID=A0AAD5T2T1_9FUNG|nr:hypothetical protein HK100_009969 [Physocladia obscura]
MESGKLISESRGVKVWMFANGDVFNEGKRIVVSNRVFKNYEQFLLQTSKDLNLLHGAVRKIYTMQGEEINSLTQLRNGYSYVAVASGEIFKNVAYRVPEKPGKSMLVAKTGDGGGAGLLKTIEKRKPHDDITDKNDKPLFTNTSKGYRVIVYLNGNDKLYDLKIVLNFRNCKSYERFLSTLSQIFNRRIRRVYDAQKYTRIKCLQDLKDGHNLVVSTEHDPLQKLKYPHIDPLIPPQKVKEDHIQKVLTFYPNGDAYHRGYQLTVKKARFPTLQSLLDQLNTSIQFVTGRATRIYRLDTGTQVLESDLSPLFSTQENAPTKFVLVSGDDVFFNIKYDMNAYTKLVFGGQQQATDSGDGSPVLAAAAAPIKLETKKAYTKAKHSLRKGGGGDSNGGENVEIIRALKTPRVATKTPVNNGHSHKQSTTKPSNHSQKHEDEITEDLNGGNNHSGGGGNSQEYGDENLKQFKSGDFKKSKKEKKSNNKSPSIARQKVQYHDGQKINVDDLPPLPSSPAAPRGGARAKTAEELKNLPPLPMSPSNGSNAY